MYAKIPEIIPLSAVFPIQQSISIGNDMETPSSQLTHSTAYCCYGNKNAYHEWKLAALICMLIFLYPICTLDFSLKFRVCVWCEVGMSDTNIHKNICKSLNDQSCYKFKHRLPLRVAL